MGSKKKKDASESSSSSSESESGSSDSSTEKRSRHKSKEQLNAATNLDTENSKTSPQKIKSKSKAKKQENTEIENDENRNQRHRTDSERKEVEDDDKDGKHRKRRRSLSQEKSRKTSYDKRMKEERRRYDDSRNRNNEYNRSYDGRHRERWLERRNSSNKRNRHDERNVRNRRDDRDYTNKDRNRSNRQHYQRRRSRSGSFDHGNAKWGKDQDNHKKTDKKEVKDKQKPNFALSGKLAEETNTYRGVVIKYSEPPEARKPKRRWRLYPFKGEKALQTLYIHRESAYLIGRDRKVVDLPIDHPSCSKQHAALQYRLVPFTRDDGSAGKRVRPYLIDLNSANGTHINNKKIEASKYVELLEKDVIKFGFSSREYVLLHENSKDEAQDDDVKQEVVVKTEEN